MKGLQLALEKAGYEAKTGKVYISANSLKLPVLFKLVVELAFRIIGEAEYSISVIGIPKRIWRSKPPRS